MPADLSTPHYPDLLRLDGKGFVILGAGPGIGREVAQAITQSGGRVLCADLNGDMAQETAALVGGEGIQANVTKRADLQAVFARAGELFGSDFKGVVDVVGITIPNFLPDYSDDDITNQFDLVLRHAILSIQIAGPMLAANGGGSITLVGSLAGLASTRKATLYGVAKGALHQLAAFASHEFGPQGVRVNVVAPGRILSSGTIFPDPDRWAAIEAAIPLGRAGVPSDIAGPILFLASDLAKYVTGNVIAADGGISKVSALPSSLV